MKAESYGKERRGVRERAIPPNLSEILDGAAQVLRDNGCSQTLIRAALLSLCGVEIRELNITSLSVW